MGPARSNLYHRSSYLTHFFLQALVGRLIGQRFKAQRRGMWVQVNQEPLLVREAFRSLREERTEVNGAQRQTVLCHL